RAMFAVLFGSYSTAVTVAGIPSFFLLKSTSLYFLLLPPPRCLTVIFPWLLRPEFFFRDTTKDFSGVVAVISEKSEPVICLLEGVYGVYVLMPIVVSPFSCHPPYIAPGCFLSVLALYRRAALSGSFPRPRFTGTSYS